MIALHVVSSLAKKKLKIDADTDAQTRPTVCTALGLTQILEHNMEKEASHHLQLLIPAESKLLHVHEYHCLFFKL